jgi:hypothetical protein
VLWGPSGLAGAVLGAAFFAGAFAGAFVPGVAEGALAAFLLRGGLLGRTTECQGRIDAHTAQLLCRAHE